MKVFMLSAALVAGALAFPARADSGSIRSAEHPAPATASKEAYYKCLGEELYYWLAWGEVGAGVFDALGKMESYCRKEHL